MPQKGVQHLSGPMCSQKPRKPVNFAAGIKEKLLDLIAAGADTQLPEARDNLGKMNSLVEPT
jgi:hypothetical protein